MPRVITLLLLLGIFAVGVIPAKAFACDTRLAFHLMSQCSNAVHADDDKGTAAFCQSTAEQAGVCADESSGNGRAGYLQAKVFSLELAANANASLGNYVKALNLTDSADGAAHEILSMPGIKALFKSRARYHLNASMRIKQLWKRHLAN